jgi:hypothetical protein
MSVVTHPDTTEIWVTRGFLDPDEGSQRAIAACTEAMGEGCLAADSWSNTATISVVSDTAGNLFVKGAASGLGAIWDARSECGKYSEGCHKIASIDNSRSEKSLDFPATPVQRRLFGAVARIKGTPPEKWDDAAWIVTGKNGFMAAEQMALANCRNDSGMDCDLRVSVGNGLIGRLIDNKGSLYWVNIGDPKAVEKQIRNTCPKDRDCHLLDSYDVRTPRTWTMQVSESEAPARGFYSLARPADDTAEKAWGMRALVTGRKTVTEAKAAAIALCESATKAHCIAFPEEGDRGTDAFIALARTSDGEPKWVAAPSEDAARQYMDESCTKHHQTCLKSSTFDLGKSYLKPVTFK